MTRQEQDAATVDKARDFILERVRRFEEADGKPYTDRQIMEDVAYVARKNAGNFGGAYVRQELLACVAESAIVHRRLHRFFA